MYLCMAFGSLQRPSIMMTCELTFWRALSDAQPALALCGRILRGMSDPGGSIAAKVAYSHLWNTPRLSEIWAKRGNRSECPGAFNRFDACKYQVITLPTEVYVGPRAPGIMYCAGLPVSDLHGNLME